MTLAALGTDALWIPVKDGDARAYGLYRRHYSARKNLRPRIRQLVGPGEHMILLTPESDALFVWRKFIDASGQQGVNCSVFRNEGERRSSDLIREAVALAKRRWPGERLYTYVNAAKVSSPNPGYCFKMAGWRRYRDCGGVDRCVCLTKPRKARCGKTKGGLLVLECRPASGGRLLDGREWDEMPEAR